MSKFIDLTGQRFGRLVVTGRAPENYRADNGFTTIPRYICQCDCGNTTVVLRSNLKTGRTRSCGCIRREAPTERARARREQRNG